MKQERVRIKTVNGRIYTLTISERTPIKISGTDKFGNFVIIPIRDIIALVPQEMRVK